MSREAKVPRVRSAGGKSPGGKWHRHYNGGGKSPGVKLREAKVRTPIRIIAHCKISVM